MLPSRWWQRAVIYQVYPRSFQDGNGDGVGDLPGLLRRLDYLAWLGADAIWLSPVYPSPMADFGYDVADYEGVDPLFGSLDDLDRVIARCHELGMRFILDWVPNHTSDQHPWFLEARSSRSSPRRAYYLWSDPAPGGGPPNNWASVFGGSAWQWDDSTRQYYYHSYLPEQPDLNWRNPEVVEAMLGTLSFWLARGVDGFRIDALRQLMKDHQLRDNPPNPDAGPSATDYHRLLPVYTTDRPELHSLVKRFRAEADRWPGERLLIGELYLPIHRLVTYYGDRGDGLHLPFNFHLINTPWRAADVADLVRRYEAALPPGAWPTWVLGNHDNPRLASRLGAPQARAAAMLLLALRGTPTLYYGDELGMLDVDIPPERVRDPAEKRQPGKGAGRDGARTPMPWDRSPNGGFTRGEPWLPLAESFAEQSVEAQRDDPRSLLSLYRRLIHLRWESPALALGSISRVEARGGLLCFVREAEEGERLWVAVNLGEQREHFKERGTVRVATHRDLDGSWDEGRSLEPGQGVVLSVP